MTSAHALFSPFQLGDVTLKNRVVMAAMTRGRARNAEHLPTGLHVEYYRQRASAGLIISESTWISDQAIGFINVPGIYTKQQVEAWRPVTDAVHAEGGRIFLQLAHSGAISHPDFYDGGLPIGPSAVNPGLRAFTAGGFKATVTPRAMSIAEIYETIGDYGAAAGKAIAAGFDGVEIHGATTYLLPEFLNSALNVRRDEYGGSPENRARLVLEVLEAAVDGAGAGRVGLKISPTMAMGGFNPTDETVATYDHLVDKLNDLPLSHLQVVKAPNDLTGTPIEALQDTVAYYRARYRGTVVANFGFDASSAERALQVGEADLVSFGKPFISNPDFVRRARDGLALSPSNPETYYQGEAAGYTDYPPAA